MSLVSLLIQLVVSHGQDLVGLILPPFVDIVNKDVPNEEERFLVTLLVCFLVALFLKWPQIANGSPDQVITDGALVFMESQLIYKLYFAKSFLRSKLIQKINQPEADPTIPSETELATPIQTQGTEISVPSSPAQ